MLQLNFLDCKKCKRMNTHMHLCMRISNIITRNHGFIFLYLLYNLKKIFHNAQELLHGYLYMNIYAYGYL